MLSTFGCFSRSPSEQVSTVEAVKQNSIDGQTTTQDIESVMPMHVQTNLEKLGLSDLAVTGKPLGSELAEAIENKKRNLADSLTRRRNWIQAQEIPRETWEVQYRGNTPIGYSFNRVKNSALGTEGILRIDSTSLLRISNDNENVTQQVKVSSVEQTDGKLRSIEMERIAGDITESLVATVALDRLRIRIENKDGLRSRDIPWRAEIGGPFTIIETLKGTPLKPGETRELDMLDPLLNRIVAVTLVAGDYVNSPKLDGEPVSMLEIRSNTVFENRELQTVFWVDEKGEILKTFTSQLDLRSFKCEESMAYRVRDSLLSDSRVPPKIEIKGDTQGIENLSQIFLRVGHKEGDTFRLVPHDEHQKIQTVAPFDVTYIVTRTPVLDNEFTLDPEQRFVSDPSYRGPTPLLQANDIVINRIAEKSLKNEELGAQPLKRLVHGVKGWIKEQTPFTPSMKTAAETARSFRGSANEYAILLAAVVRTQGIPSRVVSGVRCRPGSQPPVMEYHAWTEVEAHGTWVAVDATQPDGEINATYLRLTESSMSNYNPYEVMLPTLDLLDKLSFSIETPK